LLQELDGLDGFFQILFELSLAIGGMAGQGLVDGLGQVLV